jgi:hypothetical protein
MSAVNTAVNTAGLAIRVFAAAPSHELAMNARDRVRLLFGPYRAPRLRKGDRATCLLLDTTVIITGWTDARISWPLCRPLDNRRGRPTILPDDELARAVRHEAAAAIRHHWGVSVCVVWRWRKALGVGRMDSEGSRRLIQAAVEAGADVTRGVPLSEEECARRSRTNREKDLKRHLHPGYHGPRWTPQELALLGTLPDEEVAARIGKTPGAVRQKREELGIPNPAANSWTAEDIALLGTLSDEEVAARLGRSRTAVTQKRCQLGIANAYDRRRRGSADFA